jgi:hypothetical protein
MYFTLKLSLNMLIEQETITALVASLKRRGVSDNLINEALNEVVHPTTV